LSGKLQEVIEEVNSIGGGDIFCLIETEKKVQASLCWLGWLYRRSRNRREQSIHCDAYMEEFD